MGHLTEEEKEKVAAQVEYFVQLMEHRYGLRDGPAEVQAALIYIRERKAFADRIRTSTMITMLGMTVSAVMLALWEGVKAILRGER